MKKSVTTDDLLKLTEKVWLNTADVACIGNCSREKALKVKKNINEALKAESCYVHRDVVPATRVISAFGLTEIVSELRASKGV